MIKIDKRVLGPKFCAQFFPCHHFARTLQQHQKNLEGLLAHLHSVPELPQFTGPHIQFIRAE